MKNKIFKTITLSVLASSVALAATPSVPNIADIEKQVKPPKIEKQKTEIPQISQKEYKSPMKDNGKTIFIKSFTFSGNIHISDENLQILAQEYEKQELSFTQISKLTSMITKLYRQEGYFVARAYIPAQNLNENDGILEIVIIEGNYGKFELKNNSLVKDSIVQGVLNYAKRDNIVSTMTLEQSMLMINDMAGVIVTKADVMPGSEVGTSDFVITTEATKRYDGYIVVDNTGSRYTGKNRAMAGVNINSPFQMGDKLSFGGLVSNGADLTNARISYSLPLMSNGLIAEISYSQTHYSLVEEYESLDAKGVSKTIEGKFKYPIIRTRAENFYVNLSLISKDLKDEVDSTNDITKKDTKSLKLGIDYDKNYFAFGLGAYSKISANYTFGKLSFDDSADLNSDEIGANTNGNYSKINIDLEHNIALNSKLSLETSLKLQYALNNKNLDGSEDFSIGGAYGIKVYPDSELSAENGYLFNIELKYQLPQFNALNSSVGIFYDRGKAYMADNSVVNFDSKSLQDVGIGYYASYKDFFGQIQVAWTANSDAISSEPTANSRVLAQAGWVF